MTAFDELRKVFEEEREQQHLNVRAVYVRVRQNADLAVAQIREIDLIVGTVRIDADGHRNVMHFVVGEEPVAFGFPRVQHLAAQRQNGLKLLVAAHFRGAARRIALDEEKLVARDIGRFAVRELARQHGHARALALLDLLTGARAPAPGE